MSSSPRAVGDQSKPHVIIHPGVRRNWPDLAELVRFRHLLYALIWRNLSTRYKSTFFGPLWIMMQPLLQMGVYTLIFGIWARIPVHDVPYALFVMGGLVQVFFLNRCVGEGGNLIRSNQGLTKKVYFPKLVLPLVLVSSAFVDYLFANGVYFSLILMHGRVPEMTILLFPLYALWLAMLGLAFALWFSALGILYKDVTMLAPPINMLLMFMSPNIYPITMVPEHLLPIYFLNPLVGIVLVAKWAVLGIEPVYTGAIVTSLLVTLLLLISGLVFFVRAERSFNDYL